MASLPQRPTGDHQLAGLYVRVSSKEQVEGYSLDAQRRACRDFCTLRGYTVVTEYADEGISAHTDNIAKRPGFARMLADAEAGQFNIIVVHKMDRFARKLRIALECLERLGKSQVGVVSISEPNLDFSTPQGFLFLSMLGALAEWYSRNLAVETAKGWAERKQKGLYAGRLPFGAAKGEDGVPVPDTQSIDANGRITSNHEGLILAFERAAEGATDSEVAETLNMAGYRPLAYARRARFTREAARTILQNRFYVGELPIGKRGSAGWLQGAHEPLISPDLFDAVRRQRSRRATAPNPDRVNKGAHVSAVSGLTHCAECGEPMHREGNGRLSCWGRRQAQGCRAPTAALRIVEDELGAYLRGLRFPDDARQRIFDAFRQAKPETTERERQRQAAEGQLRRLGDLFVLGDLPKAEYETRRQQLRAELSRLEETEAHARPEILEQLQRYLLDAGAAWDDAEPAQRNRLARALFEVILVRDRHIAAVRPRPEFQPYFVLAEETTEPSHQSDETALSQEGSGGGLEGIRTPDLQRDRLAC